MKMPSECTMTEEPASHDTSRGEYAVALNWTITNASENTRPVSGSVPEAIAESTAKAPAVFAPVSSGKYRASSLGTTAPRATAAIA